MAEQDNIRYVAKRHETGKTNRFFIVRETFWGFHYSTKVLKKWLKPNEVKMWLDLLKEE
jgi:hypothetical protein